MINTKTMTSEMTQNQDDNPYKRVVLNNVYKIPEKCPEMKNWSIFSDNIRYVQHDKITTQNLDIDTLDYREHKDVLKIIVNYSLKHSKDRKGKSPPVGCIFPNEK